MSSSRTMSPRTVSRPSITVHPKRRARTIGRHMLADGEHLVIDLAGLARPLPPRRRDRPRVSRLLRLLRQPAGRPQPPEAARPRRSCNASAEVALHNPANSDVYTTYMAEFVETFARVAMPADMPLPVLRRRRRAGRGERAQDRLRLEGAQEPGRGQGREGQRRSSTSARPSTAAPATPCR